jgi:hypothetical protein
MLAALLAGSAAAQSSLELGDRRLDAIDDPVLIEFNPGGTPPGLERIASAIEAIGRAGAWKAKPQRPGQWTLVRDVGDRHWVQLDAVCDDASCKLHYVDSENLMYRDRKQSGASLRAIHKSYNTWVRDLAERLAASVGARGRITYGYASLTDADAVPHVGNVGRAAYREFLKHAKPRAFAIAPTGAWGWSAPAAGATYQAARFLDTVEMAMRRCEKRGAVGLCKLYAVDDRVVWEPDR